MDAERRTDRDDAEPLIEGLDAVPSGSFHRPLASEELRRSLRQRTTRAIRSRIMRRRLMVAALVVLAYAGGLVTAYRVSSPITGQEPEQVAVSPPGESAPTAPAMDPGELERQAAGATPEERVRLLRRAGDIYLSRFCDVQRALECYRRVLDAMPPPERTVVVPGDSWLLLAMKEARR